MGLQLCSYILSDGLLYTLDIETNIKEIYSSNFSCPESGFTIEEIEPDYSLLIIPQVLVMLVMV